MYVWIEDWSLRKRRYFKVFASFTHPRKFYNRGMMLFEVDSSPFKAQEVFDYGIRGNYLGSKIESIIQSLSVTSNAMCIIRALFRYSNREDTRICQDLMEIFNPLDHSYLVKHPLHVIDMNSLMLAAFARGVYDHQLHVDVYLRPTINRFLSGFSLLCNNYGKNQYDLIISRKEAEQFRSRQVQDKEV